MKFDGIIPFINVRYVTVEAISPDGGRHRMSLDCSDKTEREKLYRYRNWELISIHTTVKADTKLQSALIITVQR